MAFMPQRESASVMTAATPETIFRLVTDPWMLPSWNPATTSVVAAPQQLADGSEWMVQVRSV